MTNARELREIRDSDGRVTAQAEYLDGKLDGQSKVWSKDGTLILEDHYRNGERHGIYQSWWDNGAVKEQGRYVG